MTMFGYVPDPSQDTPLMAEVIEGLKQKKFYISQCSDCKKFSSPPRRDCKNCGSPNYHLVEHGKEGRLVTWTKVLFAPESAKWMEPYYVGVAEFEDGLRLTAHLINVEGKPEVGWQVRVGVQDLDGDKVVYTLEKI